MSKKHVSIQLKLFIFGCWFLLFFALAIFFIISSFFIFCSPKKSYKNAVNFFIVTVKKKNKHFTRAFSSVDILSFLSSYFHLSKMGWRLGLQAVTGFVSISFFMGLLYRPASLYHPQRRAILHLKNQRKKVIYDTLTAKGK